MTTWIRSSVTARVEKRLGVGQGRNSQVFLAHDPNLDGRVVIKVLTAPTSAGVDEHLEEARRLYKVGHANVAPINYVARVKTSKVVRIVMPYFDRGSVTSAYGGRPLAPDRAESVMRDVLTALQHVHANDIVHLDVKPTNILVSGAGRHLLADFGQSRLLNRLGIAAAPLMYGLHFPPEVLSETMVTRSADIYQCGVTLFRLLSGHSWWMRTLRVRMAGKGLRHAITNGSLITKGDFLPHIPKGLRRIVMKATNRDPEKRFRTVQDMRNALAVLDLSNTWELVRLSSQGAIWRRVNHTHEERAYIDRDGTRWKCWCVKQRRSDGHERRQHMWTLAGATLKDANAHLRTKFEEG